MRKTILSATMMTTKEKWRKERKRRKKKVPQLVGRQYYCNTELKWEIAIVNDDHDGEFEDDRDK